MIRKTLVGILSGIAAIGATTLVGADTLELRDGKSLDGVLIGATGDTLYLRTEGQVRHVKIDDVAAIRFDERPLDRSAADTADRTHKRAVIVAAGTSIMVLLPKELAVKNPMPGERFTAKLSEDFKSGDVLVAPAGSTVFGQIVPAQAGGPAMILTEVTVDGDRLPIKTRRQLLPATSGSPTAVEFVVEQPFTLRLASN